MMETVRKRGHDDGDCKKKSLRSNMFSSRIHATQIIILRILLLNTRELKIIIITMMIIVIIIITIIIINRSSN